MKRKVVCFGARQVERLRAAQTQIVVSLDGDVKIEERDACARRRGRRKRWHWRG